MAQLITKRLHWKVAVVQANVQWVMLHWNSVTRVSTCAVAYLRWDGNSSLNIFSTSWVHNVLTTQQNKSRRTRYLRVVLFLYTKQSEHTLTWRTALICKTVYGNWSRLPRITSLPPRTRARSKIWNSLTDDISMYINLFALRTKQSSIFVKPLSQYCCRGLTHIKPLSPANIKIVETLSFFR